MTSPDLDILIVDGSPLIRRCIRKAADVAGLNSERIYEAANGQLALELIAQQAVDIVFLDLNMPVMDGETFLRSIRSTQEHAKLPVVIVSTESNQECLDRLKELGIADYLHKPFEPEKLRQLVVRIMGETL